MTGKPIKIVNCLTWGAEIGNGIARMDSLLYRFLDKSRFEMVMAAPDEYDPSKPPYDPFMPIIYTGADSRFEALVKIFGDADIVQYSGGFMPIVAEAARVAGVPSLLEVMHHLDTGQLDDGIAITVCASETVRRVQRFPGKCRVIMNGIDLEAFPFHPKPAGEKIVILQASNRIKPYFNLDELADILLPLDPRIELWLAGPGQTMESSERVKFLGVEEDMPGLYSQADMLVLLSKTEAFGLVVAEAMASGLLPIACDKDGPAEIITDGVDGWLVAPGDKPAVADAVRKALKVLGSPAFDEMRSEARRTIETRFPARRYASEFEKLYLELAAKNGRRLAVGPQWAAPTPEAEAADAIFHYKKGDWDRVFKSLCNLSGRPEPLTKPAVAQGIERLARHAIIAGKPDAALLIYPKLHASGFLDAEWMKIWFSLFPRENIAEFPVDDLIATGGGDAEAFMVSTGRALDEGRINDALETLTKGASAFPDSEELKQTLALLMEKLGGAV